MTARGLYATLKIRKEKAMMKRVRLQEGPYREHSKDIFEKQRYAAERDGDRISGRWLLSSALSLGS